MALLAVNLALLRRVFAPLDRLSRFMRRVDPLRPGARVPTGNADPEIAELTAAFNDMIHRIENERRDSALRALAALEGERRRIARKLHDEVGQALTAATTPTGGALALGACFGGNATLIAAANVAAAGLASRAGRPVGFMTFLKVGLPATLIPLVLGTAYIGVRYP